ncbi:hypothetical protein C8R45DRAFT_415202 [Mycena sanguinolenta]|nr:hypothetical protein C8R45DRAFT_415202 [Mycena sanguinolenta]
MDSAPSFNTTLGAMLIGVLVSYILFGVTTTQSYFYYRRFPEDSSILKALAAFVWICEFVNTTSLGAMMYTFTVSDFTHPERITGSPVPKSLSVGILFSGVVAACVHGFFAFRIYAFQKKLYLPAIFWFTAFILLSGRIVAFATSLRSTSVAGFFAEWEWLLVTNWSISVASDFMLAATLVIILLGQRSRAHKRTAAIVDKLIAWTIETGMLTSLTSIVLLACFLTMKTNFIWLAVYAINTRLFSNSLIASLNSRAALHSMNANHAFASFTAPGRSGLLGEGELEQPSDSVHMKGLAIHIHKIQESDASV